MQAPKPSINVNVTYDIHQQPAFEFHANQRNAFILAGIPYFSHGIPGCVSTCTAFGVSTLQTLPRALGGTGYSDDIALDEEALHVADAYYQLKDGYGEEAH